MTRANHDPTQALDEVLAERNKLCLETTKLGSENVRIWNLVRRFKKENEELKVASRSASSASNPVSLTPVTTVLSPSPSDSGLDNIIVGNPSTSHLQPSSRGNNILSSSQSLSSTRQSKGSETSSTGIIVHPSSPLSTSISAPHSATYSTDSALHEPIPSPSLINTPGNFSPTSPQSGGTPREVLQSPQQASIMQQRAAAQAQRLASMTATRVAEGNSSRRNSLESFDAIDGSSVGNSDPEEARSTPFDQSRPGSEVQSSYQASPLRIQKKQSMASSSSDRRISTSADSFNIGSSSPLSPRLDAIMLQYVNVAVVGTNFRANERAKEDISFFISVDLRGLPLGLKANVSSWRVEKLYSAILALDGRLKQKHGKNIVKRIAGVQLPDRNLFKDHAPSKVDQRKLMLEAYLQNILAIPLTDKADLCTFLCTDAVPVKTKDPEATTKEGQLTKKGANLGRWVTRLYCLAGTTLDYYELRGGPQLGSISIVGAQIGRQQKSDSADMDENSYRHAFLILESKPPLAPGEQRQMVRHVLCAESDEERDEWVDVLVRAIASTANASISNENGRSSPLQSVAISAMPTSPTSPAKRALRPESGRRTSETVKGSVRDVFRRESGDDTSSTTLGIRQSPRPARQPDLAQSNLSPPLAPMAVTTGGAIVANALGMTRSRSDLGRFSLDDYSINQTANSPSKQGQSNLLNSQQGQGKSSQGRAKSNTLDNAGSLPRGFAGNSSTDIANHGAPSPSSNLPESSSITSGLGSKPRPSISGPMNGTLIPSGYKFGGGKEEPANAGQDTKKRFWHRFGGAGGEKGSQSKKVFGVSLAESIAVSNVSEGLELPSVVYRCIEYLEKRNAALEEGIYRLSGSSAVIKSLRERFNIQGDVNLLAPSEPFYDPHAIAGLLKQFLRELTDSVLTRELHFDFLRVNELLDRKERVNELSHLVSLLPLANYSLLRTLCNHLIKVIEKSDINKMTMRNVGIVFSPTLGIPGGVFALFMTEFDWVFFTDAKGEPAPKQIEEDILAPDNSELGIRDQSVSVENNPSPIVQTVTLEEGSQDTNNEFTEPLSPGRTGRNVNRSSWISGDAIHGGDGRVMMNLSNKRDNRNSLSYNKIEADKLLGGPQSKFRLSAHHEELEATLDNMILTNSHFVDQAQFILSQDEPLEPPSDLSPLMSTMALKTSPLSPTRPLHATLAPDAYLSHHQPRSNPGTPTHSVSNPRLRSNSHNPRVATNLMNNAAYGFDTSTSSSSSEGH